jgi:hypothetical protein
MEHFYPLARRYGFTSEKEVRDFLSHEVVHDKLAHKRAVSSTSPKFLPIFSKYPDAYQFDTFFVKKRAYLAFININTRKAYIYEMEDKSTAQVVKALKKFLSVVKNVKILQSDQDSAYLSKEFLDIIRDKHIGYTTTTDNDHHLLGIVNRFIRTVRDTDPCGSREKRAAASRSLRLTSRIS